jgi:hypothetical protein
MFRQAKDGPPSCADPANDPLKFRAKTFLNFVIETAPDPVQIRQAAAWIYTYECDMK